MSRPRITLDVTQEEFFRMHELIPKGIQSKCFAVMLTTLLDDIELHGQDVLGVLLSRSYTMEMLMKQKKKEERNAKNVSAQNAIPTPKF